TRARTADNLFWRLHVSPIQGAGRFLILEIRLNGQIEISSPLARSGLILSKKRSKVPQSHSSAGGKCGKTGGRPGGAKHRKFASSNSRVSHWPRDRAPDGRRPEGKPVRASGRHHDPDRLPPRFASMRVVRPAMVPGRVGRWPPARPQGKERLAKGASHAGRRGTCPATPTTRTGGIPTRLYCGS